MVYMSRDGVRENWSSSPGNVQFSDGQVQAIDWKS